MSAVVTDSHKRLQSEKARLGLWIYIMSDLVLFSSLFALLLILRPATDGGVSGRDIFDLPFVLAETVLLLVSSVSAGIAFVAAQVDRRRLFQSMLALTILLGLSFLAMEIYEFSALVAEGSTWQVSAFLSAFFTLVGTHGIHITVGLIWAITLLAVSFRRGITVDVVRKVGLFAMFWHFLDIVWIFIFSVVYLMGVI